MLTSMERNNRPFNPALRGYHAVYRENEVNRCPGCGRTHWIIGRMLAECGFCATALPLSEAYSRGPLSVTIPRGGRRPELTARAA